MRPASTWSYQSSPFSDAGNRYSNNYGRKENLSAAQRRANFAFQAKGVHLGIDRLREAYPNQYTFSQLPTASYSTMYSDTTINDYLDDNNTISREERPDLLPQQHFGDGDKSYVERRRRFYAMQPLPVRESILSKLARPAASIRGNRKNIKRYQPPFHHFEPHYGIANKGNVIKRSQAIIPGSDSGKWNLSNSFYADSFDGSARFANTPNQTKQHEGRHLLSNRFYQADSFRNPTENRQTPGAILETKEENNTADRTIDSIYSFDDSQQNETFDRGFQQNYSYRFQRYPRR